MKNEGNTNKEQYLFRASAEDIKKIPGNPIAYWISDSIRLLFSLNTTLDKFAPVKKGIDTGENDRFLRMWYEVNNNDLSLFTSKMKWYPYIKGGEFRKWYGNFELVINWENNGFEIRNHKSSTIRNQTFFYKPAITWSLTGTKGFAARIVPSNCLFDNNGSSVFPNIINEFSLISYMNSIVSITALKILNPTVAFQVGDICRIPISKNRLIDGCGHRCYILSKFDWDSYEYSWDFTIHPLLNHDYRQSIIADSYVHLHDQWIKLTTEMQQLEEENNRIYIEAYGLQNELTSEVPMKEITLTCNPHYRYGGDKSEEELELLLQADTMKEFISYSVGCMFGRYSLDKPGLILANQGDTVDNYFEQIPEPIFMPDKDNVIPILDGDWFFDDITERFKRFLRVTFGDEHYEENLEFIEKSIGKDIRKYFLKDFYADHVKRYKKRPIYWLFSSPSGSFNALIYMHRYQPDTVSVVLNDYLREFRTKLTARRDNLDNLSISPSATQVEKTKALKEIEQLRKILEELETYERDTMYPLATQQIEIDLDDGVKVNYLKFGDALKKIPGLDKTEE